MNIPTSAIRTARRLLAPVYESFEEAYSLDHAVCPDGYGSEELNRQEKVEEERILSLVASRYGVDPEELEVALHNASMEETHREFQGWMTPAPQDR